MLKQDIFVNSHRDEDYYRGLKKINEKFKIKSIWDSGQLGENTDSADYNYYMYLQRELKKKSKDNLLVPTASNAILKTIDTVDIYRLAAEADFVYQDETKVLEHAAKYNILIHPLWQLIWHTALVFPLQAL